MVSADEIRRRVEEADRKKTQERADSAEAVLVAIDELTAAEAAVSAAREKIATAISNAQRVMNLAELAAFTSTSVPKLTTWSKPTRTRGRRKSAERSTADTAAPAAEN